MKKLLVVVVALASVNAFATRARMNSLGNSTHLIDTNTVFTNPSDMFSVGGDYVNLESGSSNVGPNTAAPAAQAGGNDAEGMVVRSYGDAKAGLAIGHDSALGLQIRSLAVASFANARNFYQQNPVELSYGMKAGDLAWAGTLVYSNYASKTAAGTPGAGGGNEKESTLGARFGVRAGAWDAYLGLGLGNTYQNDTDGKFTGTLGVVLGGGMWMDTLYFSGKLQTAGYKVENISGAETSKVNGNIIDVNVVDSRKKDGNEFFYGAGLHSYMSKDDDAVTTAQSKVTQLTLPIIIGLEQKANSWLTLRGSVTQTVFLNNTKVELANGNSAAETAPGANNTAVAVGAGLNFDKITIDGTLKGLTTSSAVVGTDSQQLNGNSLLAQVGLTYMF